MNTINGIDIVNGEGRVSSGFRQVAFSASGIIRPVQSAKWGGKLTDRHTRQRAMNGDFVLHHSWSPHLWTLFGVHEGRLTPIPNGVKSHAALLAKLPKELDEFLKCPTENQPSFLPAGFGWDGVNTINSLQKIDGIRHLFKGLSGVEYRFPGTDTPINWLDEVCRQAKITSHRDIPMKPGKETWGLVPFDRDEESALFQQAVLFKKNGMVEIYTPMEGETLFGVGLADDVEECVVMQWHPHSSENGRFGIKWDYYTVVPYPVYQEEEEGA